MTPEEKKAYQKAYHPEWKKRNLAKVIAYRKAYKEANRKRLAAESAKWRQDNPEAYKAQMSAWYEKNKERWKSHTREWAAANPEKVKAAKRAHFLRKHNNPYFRLVAALRTRLRGALNGRCKSARTLELIGCPVPELQQHLTRQFKPGMAWENYGLWQVDHIRPCDSFDLSDPAQQRECFNFSNLQPLWKTENLSKGNKYARP